MGQYPHRRPKQNRRPIPSGRPQTGNLPIRVAAVLFCLTLLSTYLVTGLFARYAVTAQINEQARVAAFSITGGGALEQTKGITATVSPGEAEIVNLIIDNKSEVAVEYQVEVTHVTKNLPLSLEVKKDGASLATGKDKITFKDQQVPGTHKDNYELHIQWEAGSGDLALTGMVDYIAVTVTATQID